MLAEPVVETSSWLDVAARWSCRQQDAVRCDWYHGTWQYLRLLNLVSNPGWHSNYFLRILPERAPRSGPVRLLVSGCADYSAYAHALAGLGDRLQGTALDWCPTPLYATAWFARYRGAPAPELVCADAVAHRPASTYDLIMSDSFLPRFSPEALPALLQSWRLSLREGGTAVTTVRIHEARTTGTGGKPSTAQQWRAVAEASAPWWGSVSTLPHADLVDRVVHFAEHQERNAMYDIDDMVRLFRDAGFQSVEHEAVEVNGRRFARLAAI
ncbi:hypothetical protein [Krasilnikovia sp. M28-CT-15]|uniref:hypothetical protein n=1 Tax=Krasilnikovia sp. M28-CT-15 TaxID=3373540 RepID=UPI00387720C9